MSMASDITKMSVAFPSPWVPCFSYKNLLLIVKILSAYNSSYVCIRSFYYMNVGHLITCNSSTTASPVLSTHFPVRLALGTKSCSILYWIRLTSFLPKNIFNHLQIKHTWRCILPVFVNFSLFRNLFLLIFPPQKLYSASIFLWSKEYSLGIVSHGICVEWN